MLKTSANVPPNLDLGKGLRSTNLNECVKGWLTGGENKMGDEGLEPPTSRM
jgi:hypothetical protein